MKFRLLPLFLFLALGLRAAPASKITAVTVYVDRAVVTRTLTIDVAQSGPLEIAFEQLPSAIADQSLQMAGSGTAEATLLDVTARPIYVDFTPNERVKALEEELRALQKQRRTLDDRLRTLQEQGASLTRIESASTQPPTKEAPRLSLEEAARLLAFLDEQRSKLTTEQQSIDTQIDALSGKQNTLEQKLNEVRSTGGRSYKNVIVRAEARSAGSLTLALTYSVPGASWQPFYDARVQTGERAVALSCYGVVRQSTGEDWDNVDLTLSTARPSLGGSPPPLYPWVLDIAAPAAPPMSNLSSDTGSLFHDGVFLKAKGQLISVTGGAVVDARHKSDESEKDALLAQAHLEMLATSATFKIPVTATIASDNAPQKVPVTSVRLAALPEYLAIPKQLKAAFLTTKVTNSSEFPFLGGIMNVFLDGTFVASSHLSTVMPGEKFDLALGADEGIAVQRKLNNRFAEDTGLLNKGKRLTYDFTLTLQNNKKTTEKIVVLDHVPVSRHEKVLVKIVTPDEKELKPESDGTVKWTLTLKPGEKREVPLKFSVDYPDGMAVAGLE
jgi:uncharacterized protein (TIGR02231 family)